MISEYWIWAAWFTKVILYLGMACVLGGAFCYFLLNCSLKIKEFILKYMAIGAGFGLLSSTFGFFILIGSFANTGITGMWDPTYINILVNSPVGYTHILRSISFALLLVLLLIKISSNKTESAIVEALIFVVLMMLILFSFSQLGHVANLPVLAQILLTIHVLGMSLWMGALYPLWKISRAIKGFALKERMHLFGRIATFIVALLIACGASIALLLVQDVNTFIHTAYGTGFIIKLLLVISLLLLAAFNKWYFTPRLQNPDAAQYLGYSILVEMCLGLAILLTTGYITTVVGID